MNDNELFDKIRKINPHILPISQNGNIIKAKCTSCGGIIEREKRTFLNKYGCPYCSHKSLLKGFNDLQTLYPKLSEYFDTEKNDCYPFEIIGGGTKKYYWKCKNGHSFYNSIDVLKNRTEFCPYCGGRVALAGFNDIMTTHTEIAKEWDYEKNDSAPEQYTYGSSKKVWWKCSWCGKEFEQPISKRTLRGDGCPSCAKQSTSFQEQTILFYVQQYFPDAENRYLYNDKVELDIYISSIRTAIEYDGVRWHNNDKSFHKDCKKDAFCKENDIALIRFRDPKLRKTDSAKTIVCIDGNNKSLANSIVELLVVLDVCVEKNDINIERDSGQILANYRNNIKENSFAKVFPEYISLFHPNKNGSLTPDHFSWSASYQIWWKCNNCGNEWHATPNHIARSIRAGGNGCEKCSVKRVAEGNKTKVKNLDTGKIYNSIKEACADVGCRPPDITSCCTGRQKTAKGYRWAYVDKANTRRRDNKQMIRCVETGELFDSGKEAALFCNGDSRNIVACCNGKNKTSYGYHWEFVAWIVKTEVFSKNLSRFMNEKNITQGQVAKFCKTNQGQVIAWRNGVSYPKIEKVRLLSELFECSIDDLIK